MSLNLNIFVCRLWKSEIVLKWHEVMMVMWRHEFDVNVMMSLCVKACYKTESTATEPWYKRHVTYQRQMSTCWTASFTTQSSQTSSTSCVHSVSHRLLVSIHQRVYSCSLLMFNIPRRHIVLSRTSFQKQNKITFTNEWNSFFSLIGHIINLSKLWWVTSETSRNVYDHGYNRGDT